MRKLQLRKIFYELIKLTKNNSILFRLIKNPAKFPLYIFKGYYMVKDRVPCERFLVLESRPTMTAECTTNCPRECETTKFDVNIFAKQLPANKAERERIIRILAYFSDISYLEINQVPKTTESDLVSIIGGSMGFFLGLSFLSFIEIFEFILELCHILIKN